MCHKETCEYVSFCPLISLTNVVTGGPRYSGYHVPVSQNQLTDTRLDTRQEKLEGRNFILDKLCELGFGEVGIVGIVYSC